MDDSGYEQDEDTRRKVMRLCKDLAELQDQVQVSLDAITATSPSTEIGKHLDLLVRRMQKSSELITEYRRHFVG